MAFVGHVNIAMAGMNHSNPCEAARAAATERLRSSLQNFQQLLKNFQASAAKLAEPSCFDETTDECERVCQQCKQLLLQAAEAARMDALVMHQMDEATGMQNSFNSSASISVSPPCTFMIC